MGEAGRKFAEKEFPIEKIKALTTKKGHHLNEAKIVLANEVTKLCHGKINADYAFKTSQAVFGENIGDSNLPTIEIKASDLPENISITQLMTLSGMVKSGKEAKRLVNENAVKLEGRMVKDITEKFDKINFSDPQQLSIGKKKHFNIVIF